MTTNDGSIIGTTKIVDHGPSFQRWNLAILGDGYQQNELATTYVADIQNFVNDLLVAAPFNRVWSGINVYRVDVSSTDSGADDPTQCGGTGAAPKTYFDASFCYNNIIQRLLTVNNTTAIQVANQQVPGWDMIILIVNSSIHGGSGGNIAVSSTAANATDIAIHEMGHTAFGLADEYETYAGCGSGETTQNKYTGPEPSEPNVTIDTNRNTNKWRHLILASTPLPTTSNSDCNQCDPQSSSVSQGTVGAFEGAHKYHCGAYRPEFDCRMRGANKPFCAVCQQVILEKLAFMPMYAQGDPGIGIGGYDLKSTADRAFAFDYNSSGKMDHLVLYRPGTGAIYILKKSAAGNFQRVYAEGDPGIGIGGYDLKSTADRAFAFDYNRNGIMDHLALYRPGTGTIWILKKDVSGNFVRVYAQGDPGIGIGGYDLMSTADRAFAFDYKSSGNTDHLALYRPGTGTIWILEGQVK